MATSRGPGGGGDNQATQGVLTPHQGSGRRVTETGAPEQGQGHGGGLRGHGVQDAHLEASQYNWHCVIFNH